MSHYCDLTLLGVSNDFLYGLSTLDGDNLNGFCTCVSSGNCLVYRFSVIFFHQMLFWSSSTEFCSKHAQIGNQPKSQVNTMENSGLFLWTAPSSQVIWPINSSHFDTIPNSVFSTQPSLLSFPTCATTLEKSLLVKSWDSHRSHFICYRYLKDHSPVLPIVQYAKIGVSYILSCLKIGDGRKMYPDLFLPHEWKQKVFSVLFSEPRIFMLQLL